MIVFEGLIISFLVQLAVSFAVLVPGHSVCETDADCAHSGKCLPYEDGNVTLKRCLCPWSCPQVVPINCNKHRHCIRHYCDKEQKKCLCPSTENETCSKHHTDILYLNVTRDTPYVGESTTFSCCVNIDPRSLTMVWIHNGTKEYAPSHSPDSYGRCWTLNVSSIRHEDSGTYTCSIRWRSAPTKPIDEKMFRKEKSIPILVRGNYFDNQFGKAPGRSVASTLMGSVRAILEPSVDAEFNHEIMDSKQQPGSSKHKNRAFDTKAGDGTTPSPVTVQLSVQALNSTALWIGWRVNPETLGVNLKVESVDEKKIIFENKKLYDVTNITVWKGLFPGRWYTVYAETMPVKDNRTASDKKTLPTWDAFPEPPQLHDMLIQDKISRTRCEISWKPPTEPNGRILHYQVDLVGVLRRPPSDDRILVGEHRPHSVNCRDLRQIQPDDYMLCEFEGLLPNRNYTARVAAVNSAGISPLVYFEKMCVTNYGPPSTIDSPIARQGPTNDTLLIEYKPPDDVNGPITCYYLALVPYTHNTSSTYLKAPHLMEVDTYERAIETNLYREHFPRYAYIAESYTSLPKQTVIGDSHQSNDSCTVMFAGRYAPNNSPLKTGYKYVGYLIVRVDSDASIYQLKESRRRRNKSRRKRQSWLQPSYGYSDYFETIMPGGDLSDPVIKSDLNAPIIEGPSIALTAIIIVSVIILLLFVASTMLFYSYRKGWLKHTLCFEANFVPNRRVYESPRANQRDFPPISVDDLASTYLSKHRDSDFMFTVEFETLPHFGFATTASDRPENAQKNRYNDVKAFDITRVKLQSINGQPGSDYINASIVQGYKGRKQFIAAQGPTLDTMNDFWRMIWEQHVEIIVMVTNLQERYRAMCAKYWPEQTSMIYGQFEVMPVDCTIYADYVVRKFELQKANLGSTMTTAGEVRSVAQYHYTGWNDYKAPEGTIGLLRFLKRLRALDAFSSSPVLVHCSAGVGRTGTFIAIDGMMDQINEDRHADVFGFVSNLRRQRNFMVQALEQYVFIYKALAEWYLFGDTDVEDERIHEHVRELREPCVRLDGHRSNADATIPLETGLKREYERLALTLEDVRSSDFAGRPCNVGKNRYSFDVPFDHNRVILAPIVGELDRSYINATIFKGYFYKYIVTQDPLPDTIWDFWRMVVEQGSNCIVMLSDEQSLASGEKYWPLEIGKTVIYGEKPTITVALISEEESQYILVQKFHVCSSKEKETREVHQFIYKDWMSSSSTKLDSNCIGGEHLMNGGTGDHWRHSHLVPRRTASFLDLIGKVLQRQNHVADPGPVVVHCRNGSDRSGLYCAVSILLERLRAEGRVDVFQTVKTLQAQRRHVIAGLPQYEFCYEAVIDFMESFR